MQDEIGKLEDQLQQVQREIRAMESSIKDHSCLYATA
jgi:DNA-binding protein YbaB